MKRMLWYSKGMGQQDLPFMMAMLYSMFCAKLYNQFEVSASVGSRDPAATAPTKPSTSIYVKFLGCITYPVTGVSYVC